MDIHKNLKNNTKLSNALKSFVKYLSEYSSINDNHVKRHIPHEAVNYNKKIENPFKQVNTDKTSNMNIDTKLKVDKDGQLLIPFPEDKNGIIFSKFVIANTDVPTVGDTTISDKLKNMTIDFTVEDKTIMESRPNITPLTVDNPNITPLTVEPKMVDDPFDPTKTFHRDRRPWEYGEYDGISTKPDNNVNTSIGDKIKDDINKLLLENNDGSTIITTFEKNLNSILNSIGKFLKEKNKRYGNSALEPSNMFFKGNSEEGLRIRIDDKLKRIKNSDVLRKNDIVDLIGYLIILCITKKWFTFDEFID
jgi:hypothetical protein